MGNQQSQPPPQRKKPIQRKKVVVPPVQRIPQKPMQKPVQRPQQYFAHPQNFVQPPTKNVTDIMPRPESTKIGQSNIMNINQRVEQFKNTQQKEEKQFLQNLELAKEQFYKNKKTKEEKFQDELQEFEKKYNPFRILHLDYNATEDDVKKAYRKFSLKYHPDRPNGNARKFMMISQAYIYLMQKIKEMQGNSSHKELRENAKKYFEEMEEQRAVKRQIDANPDETMEVGEKNFDADKFNKLFEKNRMPTNWDKGYGDGWDDKETNESNTVINDKFTIDLFNKTFNDVKQKKMEKMENMQVMKIDGPQPQILSNLGYEELGQGNIEDFTSGVKEQMNFTDYKAAYTRANVIEYDEKYNRGDYKNLDSLVRARDTQNFTVNNEDKAWMDRREMLEKQQEEKRIENMIAFDRMAEQYSQRAKMHFIKN